MPKHSIHNIIYEPDQLECLTSRHHWIEASHARPTFCNICCEPLSGVKSRGLSCEVCKFKVHKRCINKTINNCKWTTLSSIGREIIEDVDGNILMPHQWIEGNLPIYSKCVVCEKNCGSVLKFQDFRCLWCSATVHDICKHNYNKVCPLGAARLSIVPPIALHSVQDEAWDVFRPQAMSPLLVFVNSKSGDNQGIKFLRRLKQLLNPAQVFDLIAGGPRLGLKLFRHFHLFRILICSGDGSISWVLSEIDKLDMHKQCQIAVLPLGTGNDLARVLGWGASCDDDAYLPQLLDRYEKATTKMLDRWSIMTFEKPLPDNDLFNRKMSLNSFNDQILRMNFYENALSEHLSKILETKDESLVLFHSVKDLCLMVKDFISQVFQCTIMYGDENFSDKCLNVQNKLDVLLKQLDFEKIDENDLNEAEMRESLILRANSIKKAIRNFIEYAGKTFDENDLKLQTNNQNSTTFTSNTSMYHSLELDQSLADTNTYLKTQSESKHDFVENNNDNSITSDLSMINEKLFEEYAECFSHIDSIDSCNMLPFEQAGINSEANVNKNLKKDILTQSDNQKRSPSKNIQNLKSSNVCVIVEPPSPIKDISFDFIESITYHSSIGDLLSMTTVNSSNESLNNLDKCPERVSTKPFTATRRVSCCSPLKTNDLNRLKKQSLKNEEIEKKLPIINPFVILPSWPNVKNEGGFIGQCLLANADTLCAAVSPLLDPEEALMEGFIERCVMNNYFGIGIDAKIALDFHQKREEHPSKCKSRAKNYMWYGVLGSKEWLQKTYKNLEQRVQLECDGQRIPLPSLQGIVVLNIPSFMGGTRFWGKAKEGDLFIEPSYDDKILEVVAVFGSVQMAASRIINLHHHRIAQCQSVQINILGDEGVPIQVDGEAWIQSPGSIRIIHKNRMQMLCRNKSLENSLKSWNEKLKQNVSEKRQVHFETRSRFSVPRHSITGNDRVLLGQLGERLRQQSFSEQGLLLPHKIPRLRTYSSASSLVMTSEEMELLYHFIERINSLIKWTKILSIRYQFENDLYSLAVKTDQCLERIHPNGKLLDGLRLRILFTQLVKSAQILYEETCCILHDKNSKLKIRSDLKQKLSIILANTEHELKKCKFSESSRGSLAYLQLDTQMRDDKKRRNSFWTKLNPLSFENKMQHDVCNWGIDEVATWLDTLELSEYKDNFITNDVRGQELINLTRKDLKELGMTKIGHIRRILIAVKNL